MFRINYVSKPKQMRLINANVSIVNNKTMDTIMKQLKFEKATFKF